MLEWAEDWEWIGVRVPATLGPGDPSGRFAWWLSRILDGDPVLLPDGGAQVFEGRVFGTIVWPPRGTHGFGYDPIFVPHGFRETFGEMEPAQKHAMSHRARAFDKLMRAVYDEHQ